MFEEALGWEHGVHFICVAFQNRMAASIGGNTLHNAGDLPKPGEKSEYKLASSDIHNLYSKNQNLRWVLLDEISMISDQLLGLFESALDSAAVRSPHYFVRPDKSRVVMGGYNLLFFGDWWQLPPIPDSYALFLPPTTSKTKLQETALDIFWGDGLDSLNFLAELTIQKRIEDPWYASLLTECCNGDLSHEGYCFLCGLPTLHSGSWYRDQDGGDQWLCESSPCRSLSEEWRRRSQKGESLPTLQQMECETCKKHRNDQPLNRAMRSPSQRASVLASSICA
jgi:hypothetical protein